MNSTTTRTPRVFRTFEAAYEAARSLSSSMSIRLVATALMTDVGVIIWILKDSLTRTLCVDGSLWSGNVSHLIPPICVDDLELGQRDKPRTYMSVETAREIARRLYVETGIRHSPVEVTTSTGGSLYVIVDNNRRLLLA